MALRDKIYQSLKKIESTLSLHGDANLSLEICFYFKGQEINKVVLADATKYKSPQATEVLSYLDNCDKIVYTFTGTHGVVKKIELHEKAKQNNPLNGIDNTYNTHIENAPTAPPTISGLGAIRPDFQGLEHNPAGLGYLISRMEQENERVKTEAAMRVEFNEILQEYKDKVSELKTKIQDKEREIKDELEKNKQLKTRCITYKKKYEELENAKKSFDSTNQIRQIGEKVAGIFMMTKDGGNAEKNQLIGSALLGLLPQNAPQLPQGEMPSTEHEYYTSLKRLRLDDFNKTDFLLIYNLLKMVIEKPNVFGEYIMPIMLNFGYAKAQNQSVANQQEQEDSFEEEEESAEMQTNS